MTLRDKRLPTIALAVNTPAAPTGPAAPQPPQINPLAGGGGPAAGPQAMQYITQSQPGTPMAPDVDPTTVSYYHVTVGDVFTMNKVRYQPGRIYQVAPGTYLGTLDDGSTFASHCTQINPQPKVDQ